MVASREVEFISDFSGGLNLTTQVQSLEPNQSPDAVNVDFGLRGGFTLRGGFQSQYSDGYRITDEDGNQLTDHLGNDLVTGPILGVDGGYWLGATYFNDDVVLMCGAGGELLEWSGALTDTTKVLTDDTTQRVRMDVFNRKAYFANGRATGAIAMRSWDGTTLATLGNTWNNDYTTPNGGDMPKAQHVIAHAGFMWVANTVESSVEYPHRVRFSHVQNPEDWAEDDYFDVDPSDDGDPITGLAAFQDQLLIFKRSSVWAVYGYDRDTFVLQRITSASGTCTCGAIAVNSGVAYWFSTEGNVMAYNGRSIAPIGQPIRWWSDIGKIKHGGAHRLMWADDRLWLRLQAGDAETVDWWMFVWDPSVQAFTRYDVEVVDMLNWVKLGSDADPLFLFKGDPNIYRFDRSYTEDRADRGTGVVPVPIRGLYRTSWINAGETATRKRWKRPRITAAAENPCTIRVRVFRDFDDLEYSRQQEFLIAADEGQSVWGTMEWGDNWAEQSEQYYEFERLGSSGTAYAIQYEFSSPDSTGRWWVDSIAVPFRRKKVK